VSTPPLARWGRCVSSRRGSEFVARREKRHRRVVGAKRETRAREESRRQLIRRRDWPTYPGETLILAVQLLPNGGLLSKPSRFGHATIVLLGAVTFLMTACGGESEPSGSETEPVAVESNANSASTAPVTTNNNSATLQWDAVKSADLSMYRVYFGTAPGSYFQSPGQGIPAGNVTTYTVTGLSTGTRYYFTVTAVDKSGNESPHSNEVFKDIA